MEKNLEEYLNLLNSDRCLNNHLEAKLIVEKIGQCFKEEHSQFTVNLLLSLILDENDAIFSFIWRTSLNSETTSSAIAGLKLIELFVTDFKKSTEPYFSTIFDKCLCLVDTDFAKVKELALKIIKSLITSNCKVQLDLSGLAKKLEKCLQRDGKSQETVLEQVYSILGVMFDKYPEVITKNVNWYFLQMSESLQSDIKLQKNVNSSRMKGTFEGIDGFLKNHPPPDTHSIKKIYDHIKKLGEYKHKKSNLRGGAVNLMDNRAALKLFESHWKYFAEFAYSDKDFWLEKLKVWIKQESEDRRCGYNALNSFYRMIAYIIKRDALDHGIVKQYLNNFIDDLTSESSDLWLKKSALVGLKFFVLTNVIDDDELSKFYDPVMDLVKTKESFWNFAFLPLSVECLSAFVLKLSYEDIDHLLWLQKLSVALINQYPKMETDFQSNHLVALEKSFYFLAVRNVKLLENHIDRVIYQGLIRSCSLTTLVDVEILKGSGQTKVESYKSYVSLWKHLLNLASSPNKPVCSTGSVALKKDVAFKVLDAFVKSFLRIITKLNLNADLDNFGLEAKVEVERLSDVQIFTNVVDLYQDVVPLTDPFTFSKWIIKIIETVIRLSYQHPLVAGFYKIMSATLKLADGIQYFDDRVKGDFKDQCFESLKIFLEEVLLRVDQYKTDLQTVCLETVLAAPASLVEGFAEKMVPALEVIVNLSRGNFCLLKELVKTLEKWNSSFEPALMNPILEKLLPHFDVFFQSPYFRGTSIVGSRTEGKYLKRRLVFDDSELLKLQKKLLIFIGDLNMSTAMNLIESKETGEWRSIHDKSIVYRLPFNDGKSEMNLDEMLPRIVELALCSGHRKTRITACESLYSILMVVLSHVNQLDGGFSQVFRNVFRACVTLACDSDSVVHQIFEPVTFQMIHYFSGKKAMHFTETQDVIDILMEFVTVPYNSTTRDFAAVLLREFTIWTIKQLTPEEMKTTPDNIDKILRNIYSLTLHPSYNKRLGGAVIFNRLYVVLREEDLILDSHWFLLFYHFVECLRMCERREDVTEITAAIRHVVRPLIERHEEFNEPSTMRVVPAEFEGSLLQHLVKWCLERCADVEARTRQMAMSVVEELAPRVKDCDSLKTFVDVHLPGTVFKMKSPMESFSPVGEGLMRWLSHETATFEYYRWLFEQKIVTAEKLFEYDLSDLAKDFVLKLNTVEGKDFNEDLLKQQSVISFLKLVFALRAHFYLFPLESLKLLRSAVFQPSKFGFDLNKSGNSRVLFTVLSDLMKYFVEEWTEGSWKDFFETLPCWTSPDFGQIAKSNSIDVETREVLFAFELMEVSGLWTDFAKRMAMPADGIHIVKQIYESLFHEDGRRSCAVSLNPYSQVYLGEFLKVGLKTVQSIDQVLEFVENEDKVVEEESQKVVTRGEYFQTTFKNELFGFLKTQGVFLIERIKKSAEAKGVKLMIQVLENEGAEKERVELAFSLLVCWKELTKTELKDVTLKQRGKLFLQVGLSSGKAIGTLGCLKTTSVADSIYYLADDCRFENLCPDEIEKIFNFLPYLSHFGEELDENERLKDFLNKFLIEQDAFEELKSKKGPAKSNQVHVVRGLLQSLRLTGSLVVFDFLLKMVICLEKLTTREEVESALTVFSDEKTSTQHAVNGLNLVYDHCFKDRTMFSSNVSFIYDWFLDPLMRKVSNVAFREFVTDKLVDLSNFLLGKSKENYSRNARVETKRKLCGSMILQMFVRKLSKEELDNVPPEKKEAMNDLVKNCINLFGNSCQTVPKDERRKCMCGIFNLLCSIISSRSADEKVYKLFLFDDRVSFMYEAIVSDQKYDLGMDFEEMPERRKHLTSLRKAITKEWQVNLGKTVSSIKYVQTNTLFSSSLKEDVTKFDLSVSPIRPMTSIKEDSSSEMMEIELEMDSLNNHECMASLVGIVTKMVEDNITPLPGEDERVTSLPAWLSFFLGVLKDIERSNSLKMFVLKAIYNVQEYVRAYRSEAFPVVLDSVLDLFTESPINYFLIDLIEMMIVWGKGWQELSPMGENLTKLVLLVMEKSDAVRRDIVKNNIEIAKTMVEVWKESLVTSQLSNFVFERCLKSFLEKDESDGIPYLNAHLCGVLLSNGIPAWIPKVSRQFFDFILKNFRSDNKNSKLFAEVSGLALDLLSKTGAFELAECEAFVRDKISGEGASGLVLLYSVYKYYPNITSDFIFKIFTSAWNSVDSFTAKKLEMLLSHLSRPEELEDDTFENHSYSFLSYMLGSPELEVQELCAQIVGKLLDKVTNVKVKSVVEEVLKLQDSVHASVRKRVYEVAAKFYSRGQNEEDDVRKQCKIVLLKGLNDGEEEAEEFCLKFWQETLASSSSSSPYSILLNIFREMYAPEAEDCFLNIAVKLLISSASRSDKYDESVSPHPITCDDKFRKRELILGVRQTYLLGLMLSSSRTVSSLENMASLKPSSRPYLRPTTGSLKFEPTAATSTVESAGFESERVEQSRVPKNPFKRRFFKSPTKTNLYYARWQKAKKKKEVEKDEELIKKRDEEVDVFGIYRDGDYPDVQINHRQVLKPLEVLSRKDHQIARQFLVSFYSGLIKGLSEEERSCLLSETKILFETILTNSFRFDASVFGFVFSILLNHCRNLEIDCRKISTAAASSKLFSLGALIIEEIISVKDSEETVDAKRRRGVASCEETRWLELARLYRNLEELDVLSGVFLDKLNVEGKVRKAICYENNLRWSSAFKCYESVLDTVLEPLQSEVYTESYLSCLAKLSDWSSVNKCVRGTVGDNLEDIWRNDSLLYWFVKSQTMVMLHSKELETDLKNLATGDAIERLEALNVNFGEELTVYDWLSGKLQRAKCRIDRLCVDFLASWSHLNQWSTNLRASKLTNLQTIAELYHAVKILSEGSKSRVEQDVKEAKERWKRNCPSQLDDLMIWDVKMNYRKLFIEKLKDFDLTREEVYSNLSLVKAALAQENLNLAKEYLMRVKELNVVDDDVKAECDYYMNLGKVILAKVTTGEENSGWEIYLGVWRSICKKVSPRLESNSEVLRIHNYRCYTTLGSLVSVILPLVTGEDVSNTILEGVCSQLNFYDRDRVGVALRKKGLEYLELAREVSETLDGFSIEKSNAYFELTKYLLKFFDSSSSSEAESVVRYLLRSMALGHVEARQLFGSGLNTLQFVTGNVSMETLKSESDLVPSWMFLSWINQILAFLPSKSFPFLRGIVHRIAVDYPNAIRYPFRLSKEKWDIPDEDVTHFIAFLTETLLNDSLYESFLNSVTYLASPDSILRYHLERLLQSFTAPHLNLVNVKLDLEKLYDVMFSEDLNAYRGSVFKFWDKFKQPMQDLMGKENDKDLQEAIGDILKSVKSQEMSSKRSVKSLESYSPWLARFHSLKVDGSLELPGQYDGNRKPVEKYLVKVSSFKTSVLVFDSKCRPMRIGILGNDASVHKFLIKFGEDLRQDERIQQVFGHINHKLRERKQRRKLYLDTYKVIPLTFCLGMIEWIDDEISLHQMMENALGKDADLMGKAQNRHLAFLSQGSTGVGPVTAHLIGYQSIKRSLAVTNFNVRVQEFPRDLLKKSFWNLATSPEHFIHFRANFAISHAVMSFTHWLVGIGDRHLQNTLVSAKTGRVLGIDFGYAFGVATQFLTPPELIPFRLTPQILNLMDPLKESGWIKQTMIHCSRVFREEALTILSILEIFALEPVMNWSEQASRSPRGVATDSERWNPKEKVSMVGEKLKGVNPVAVFQKDLLAGHSQSPHLNYYLEVLKGDEDSNFRATCETEGLTDEEQVECLIDLATDPHVLAKTYVGWNPWL